MIEAFRKKLKKNGQTLKWFYDELKKQGIVTVTYSSFNNQLNGYAPLPGDVSVKISEYIDDNF